MHDDLRKLADTSRTRRRHWRRLVAIAIALAVVAAGWSLLPSERVVPTAAETESAPNTGTSKSQAEPVASAEAADDSVEDDGQTPWVSPTDGAPLDLSGMPPGVQLIVALRPKALLAHSDAEKIVAALGPLGQIAIEAVEETTGRPLREVDRLLVGWRVERDGGWTATIVDGESPLATPPIARDLERLVAHTDSDRHCTVLFRPSDVLNDSRQLFAGPMAALRRPLFWFFGDRLSAASVSCHWGDSFFVELLGVPTLDVRPERVAAELKGRVDETPDDVQTFVAKLDPSLHAHEVVARLPAMLRKLAEYTRTSFDRDVVELRAYLPAVAGHNLLMAAELAVAEARAKATGTHNGPPAEASSPVQVAEQLKRVTSLMFARDTLETALRMLSEDVGVQIVIRGADLQSEGITKNQSFGIDVAERPAAEILVEILRLANPDKLATGPADPRQKLVYVIGRQSPGGPEVVFVTTRTRAAERGETLPAAFAGTQ